MSTDARTLYAPAKLNFGLRVLGRRPDGYHLIESLFVPIDLADEVTVTVSRPKAGAAGDSQSGNTDPSFRAGVEFELQEQSGSWQVPNDASNLAAEAARRFLAYTGQPLQVKVSLRKRIPVGAGMGGGSSDAGAVLRALAELCAVSTDSLAELALGLGADVPYFLRPRPALVSGIGERIEPVGGLPKLWFLLVNPGVSLATADVFRAFDKAPASLTPAKPGSTMRALSVLRGDPGARSSALDELLVNDLERTAVRLCPEVSCLQERLGDLGAEATGMSGSGATVFGLFPSAHAVQQALERAAFAPPVWVRTAQIAGTE